MMLLLVQKFEDSSFMIAKSIIFKIRLRHFPIKSFYKTPVLKFHYFKDLKKCLFKMYFELRQ